MTGSRSTLGQVWAALRSVSNDLTRLVWPGRCAACEQPLAAEETLFCASCEPEQQPALPGEPPPGVDAVLSLFAYQGPVRTALHKWKYHRRTAIGRALCEALAEALDAAGPRLFIGEFLSPSPLAVVPVPTHVERLRERGFDHTWALGKAVLRPLREQGVEAIWRPEALTRARATENLPGLDAQERKAALAGAFSCQSKRSLEQVRVLLIDDVLTSGATASECAHTLKSHGVSWVAVLSLAHTPATKAPPRQKAASP
ncbi:MAG: hypothetical protein AUK47_08140 [Deltaproteobacteria bacterium CG2_30_63_29]|nr:MAG: hypothetical protein AUK47_08140 [Deltaproteobacteria bacterium CG2_30_63_29]PJB46244.1 MAG: hypothetical protein CO108_05985 [Deltaproteobacteria bacterium CG_4_9_14_3_um_filter_63_12]